jgi:low affinity Fe/Cu permease
MRERFRRWSAKVAEVVGSPWAFLLAALAVVVWAVTGPIFHYSDTWQLVINTATTVITFLMIFLVQNTQNRDAKAIHLKLDELIRSNAAARNSMLDLEDLDDEELARLAAEFQRLRERVGQAADPMAHAVGQELRERQEESGDAAENSSDDDSDRAGVAPPAAHARG